jgi:cellulose synthase/poly-beta-1,6-N-acetylglucosamine synthase-like glycosyltransferase
MLSWFPFLIIFYILLTGVLYYYWVKIPVFNLKGRAENFTKLSVLIAVRNEAGKLELLLSDLEKQSYAKDNFEILIIDDHSEDATVSIVKEFRMKSALQIHLLKLPEGLTGKKIAMAEGVKNAMGVLIVATDGDCRVGGKWLEALESFYREKNLKMVIGGVSFFKGKTWREKILELEFSSLVGSGAASLQMGYPSMCNGANLAYEKEAFIEVNGYEDTSGLASGDDEFLMHKIYRKYPGKVAFIKNKESVVETEAPASWKAFFEQRRRWASKWEKYTYTHIKLLALLVFASNLVIVLNFVLSTTESYPLTTFLIFLTFKFMLEFLFLRSVLVYFGRNVNLGVFVLVEMIYPFYVILFALAGRMGKYKWKDREVK